jgi:signal transduction histidine kinase
MPGASRRAGRTLRSPAVGVAFAGLTVAGVTLLLYPLSALDPGVSSGVLYVLGVLLLTMYWGLWLGLSTSVASAAALGVFHGDLHKEGDVVAICVLLLTAGTASVIADRARHRADDLETRLELEEELRRSEAERIHLREVRDSRARVLAAADDERRRVVRDLHDGAQQRLVHTVVTLKMARRAYDEGNDGLRPLVDEALAQAERATEELRELARGILPSALTRGGLRAGVADLVTRIQLPVTVRVAGDRLPAAVEAPAYFLVAEALTNVVKHSFASHVDVSAWVRDGVLHVQVSDNGVGGARPDGDGLLGLADRIAAVDGALHVESPPGAGTRIAATIPVA